MRVALISDIHGNAPVLDAVLADIKKQRVNKVVCLGDIATIGPQPGQVINKLRAHDIISIDFRRVHFDIAIFCEQILHSDLPAKKWWLQQYTGK